MIIRGAVSSAKIAICSFFHIFRKVRSDAIPSLICKAPYYQVIDGFARAAHCCLKIGIKGWRANRNNVRLSISGLAIPRLLPKLIEPATKL